MLVNPSMLNLESFTYKILSSMNFSMLSKKIPFSYPGFLKLEMFICFN